MSYIRHTESRGFTDAFSFPRVSVFRVCKYVSIFRMEASRNKDTLVLIIDKSSTVCNESIRKSTPIHHTQLDPPLPTPPSHTSRALTLSTAYKNTELYFCKQQNNKKQQKQQKYGRSSQFPRVTIIQLRLDTSHINKRAQNSSC